MFSIYWDIIRGYTCSRPTHRLGRRERVKKISARRGKEKEVFREI